MKIQKILKLHYAISNATISKLEGYDSINYKIETENQIFVLKQNHFTKQEFDLLEAENNILKQVKEHLKYDVSAVVASDKGDDIIVSEGHIYRLLTYIEGQFLADINHSEAFLNSFGRFLAELDVTITSQHSNAIKAKETPWDLKHFKLNYKLLDYITNPKDRSLVNYFFLQFDENVLPVQYQLRKGIIHNDANDWNVLTQNQKVSGIIDFGDMCHTWVINELAIALTYVMMNKDNPLEVANSVLKSYHEIYPLESKEIDVLYYLIAARLCTSVCNSAYAKTLKPDSEYITISEKPAWNLLYKWLAVNPIKATNEFRKASGFDVATPPSIDLKLKERSKTISTSLSVSYKNPIYMSKSAFQYMYDKAGNTFLDAYNNIMLVGHSHPKITKAASKTLARLNTNTRYIYDELHEYSELLLSKFPSQLNKVFLVNSGSAASDLAIRIAMTHTKKNKVMVLNNGYHGNTKLGIEISAYKYNQKGGPGRQQNILETEMPKFYGSGFENESDASLHYVARTTKDIEANSNKIAAFIAEPIVGCGGQAPLPEGYLSAIYPKIKAQGGVCISDEVQVGFGRLGTSFWGFEKHNIVPDMVVIGKPMGNGHPIGAVVTTSEIAESFDNGLEFFSSFGGNPVSCSIGKAVLEVIEEENLQEHAKDVGKYLIKALKTFQKRNVEIGDVRGNGLFLGVEMVDKKGKPNTGLASYIKNNLRENLILIGTDGPHNNVLKIKPPMWFSKSNADTLTSAIARAIKDYREI